MPSKGSINVSSLLSLSPGSIWTEFVSPQNSYVETLTPNVNVSRDRIFRR